MKPRLVRCLGIAKSLSVLMALSGCGGGSSDGGAVATAVALAEADAEGRLEAWLKPPLSVEERASARVEGWILGLV